MGVDHLERGSGARCSARLAAVLHLLHEPERLHGTATLTVFLQRAALTEEKRRPFSGFPLFFDATIPNRISFYCVTARPV